MYIGTSGGGSKDAESGGFAGAAYVTRTRDPIITNNRPPRQTAVFTPMSDAIYPICAVFVSSLSRDIVHRYIGPMGVRTSAPALTTNAQELRHG